MRDDGTRRRTTGLVAAAALAVTVALAAFQGGLGARTESGQAQAQAPATSGTATATSRPSAPTGPVPADWTTLDPRPVREPDLTLAQDQPVEDPSYPHLSNPEVDALRYQLRLDWDGTRLQGRTTLTLRVAHDTDTLRLDLARPLTVTAVTLDGAATPVTRDGDGLVLRRPGLRAGSRHTVVVSYAGTPTTVPPPTHRGDDLGGLGWGYDDAHHVSTFQEPYGAFTWYPVNDHPSDKAFYDAVITAPPGQVGVFNGRLVGRSDDGGRTTTRWHLDAPASSYLTTVAIGPYRQHVQTYPRGVVASVWTLPEDESSVAALQQSLRRAYDWLEERVGPYPFSTTGMVVTAGQSAMETQTLITMGRGPVLWQRDAVTAHELAHQWFGDLVTTRDWRHTWLNEGWATYWQRRYEGRAPADLSQDAQLVEGCRQAVAQAGQAGNPRPDHFASSNIYACPALMLDEIRRTVGDAAFAGIAREWPQQHRYATVTRADFEDFVQRRTGRDVRDITARWLDRVSPAG
ncbi:M1 family metallopeptidase [Arsenicicoccus sp. oral taxon 190]|uniref:M1 family metallopeptidase n=1 Tax=Arsenicicoccus sp. oral taxon 190 TaxID=1658671 RepID=UPI00067C85ED|nr:M1 family metallopeptidase [Arsenicicoccus sp. oral taxon 190]